MSDSFDALQRHLEDAQDRERALRAKLDQAEASHSTALDERRAYLVDAEAELDVKTLADLDSKVVHAASAVAGLTDALRLASERTSEAQRQLADAQDRAQRLAEATKVRAIAAEIDKAAASLSKAVGACEQTLHAAGALCPEATAAAGLLRSSQHDLQIYIRQALNDLRSYGSAVERGGKLRRAISNEPAPKVRVPKPVTQRIYFLEFAKWTVDGQTVTARQYSTHDVAPALAQKAINCSVAVDTAHETAAKLRPIFGDAFALGADPARCVDVDLLNSDVDLRKVSPQVILAQQAKAAAA